MNTKITVCRVCPIFMKESTRTGINHYFYNVSKGLEDYGVKHRIITQESDMDSFGKEPIFKIPARSRLTLLRMGLDAYKIIHDNIKEYDIVHTHQHGFFMLYKHKKDLKKLVYTIHGSAFVYKLMPTTNLRMLKEQMYTYFLNRYIMKRADAIITVSSDERENIIKHFRIDEQKVFFIPTGVDIQLFTPKNVKKDIDLLYVGRLAIKKNIPTILKILKEIKTSNNNIKFVLIGGETNHNDYANIIHLVKEFGLEKNVQFLPPMPQRKLIQYYHRSKVLIMLSLEEGLPKAVLEAMACGIPVIGSNRCGNKDAIINGKNGYLVDPYANEDIKNHILELIHNSSLRKEMGKEGIKMAKEFTWDSIIKRILHVYHYVLKNEAATRVANNTSRRKGTI